MENKETRSLLAKATLFRSDTAESVEERKMTADELQAALPFQEAPDAKN